MFVGNIELYYIIQSCFRTDHTGFDLREILSMKEDLFPIRRCFCSWILYVCTYIGLFQPQNLDKWLIWLLPTIPRIEAVETVQHCWIFESWCSSPSDVSDHQCKFNCICHDTSNFAEDIICLRIASHNIVLLAGSLYYLFVTL